MISTASSNELTYVPSFVPNDAIDTSLLLLSKEVSWLNEDTPRDECFMSKHCIEYTYGRGQGVRTYKSVPFHPIVYAAMLKLNKHFDTQYNVCFLNKYQDQKNHLGWHSDDSPEIDSQHPIAVVSLGAEREIWWREIGAKGEVPSENKQLLQSGSLFVMPAGFQQQYQHRIPKHDSECDVRISLTYRKYKLNVQKTLDEQKQS